MKIHYNVKGWNGRSSYTHYCKTYQDHLDYLQEIKSWGMELDEYFPENMELFNTWK